ncbi:MAG: phosphoglycerate kinase [Candidatus Omnitrophica bacterium]|nr:phosphoglycerate kinase [Candidatus Omnitrophota bacterium]
MNKQTIKDVDIKGKRLLIRADFNVPLDKNGEITDDTRIVETLPTIRYAIKQGAKIILMSHLGRPKGGPDPAFSLKPVAAYLTKALNKNVELLPDCVGDAVKNRVSSLKEGDVILLENLRFHKEEEKNDPAFAKRLAEYGEIYVDDAFGAAHRAHASTEGVTHYLPSVAGLLLEKEITYFEKALESPDHPFVAILGGAKVADKIKVIENLLKKVDALLIGGGMAYTFLKVQGHSIGASKLDEEGQDIARNILKLAQSKGVKLLLPVDHVIGNKFAEDAESRTVGMDIPDGWMGLDIGPKTVKAFEGALKTAKMIIWNGPLGVFEFEKFASGSKAIAKFIASLSATTIIGGGDTASAIRQFGLSDKMSHISTGGGASLEFLEGKVLPGVAALADKRVTVGGKR